MSKQTGLGQEFYIDGIDLSGDTGSASRISTSVNPLPLTGINKEAYERDFGLRDGNLSWQSWFNPSVGAAHKTLSTLPLTNRLGSWIHRPTLGAPAACITGKQINYDPTRSEDGGLSIAIEMQSDGFGLEWTDQLTAGRDVFSGAASGSGLDYGAVIGTTAFGLQAHMQIFAFTGTSATVTIQHSNDNGGGDPYANITGAGFTAVMTSPGSQRIQTARTESVKRWLRINITGVFSNLDIAVMVAKNLATVKF